jgi:hypothetical protein
MNKNFLLACVAVFVTWFLGSFAVHGVLLHGDYAQLTAIMRTEADSQKYFPLMILAHVMLATSFVWIYSRGVEAGPWLPQGLRFAVAVAFLGIVPTYLIYYVVQPMPGALVCKQIVFDGALMLVNGVVAAAIVRRPEVGRA